MECGAVLGLLSDSPHQISAWPKPSPVHSLRRVMRSGGIGGMGSIRLLRWQCRYGRRHPLSTESAPR